MQSCFGRTDKFQTVALYLTQGVLCVVAGLILTPIVGVIAAVFALTLVPFVQDMVHKDHHEPPHERCEGCGNLYSEEETITWRSHTLCPLCAKDTESQKEYAISTPMWLKRMWKG